MKHLIRARLQLRLRNIGVKSVAMNLFILFVISAISLRNRCFIVLAVRSGCLKKNVKRMARTNGFGGRRLILSRFMIIILRGLAWASLR